MTDQVKQEDRWLEGILFQVYDPVGENVNNAKAAEAATNAQVQQQNAHGPGIYLDRDHAEAMLKRATEVKLALENDQSLTQSLERMRTAANDPVSVAFTKAATWSGGQPGAFAYGAGHVRLEILYLQELTGRLKKALGRTVQNDQNSGDALKSGAKRGGF